MNNDFIEVNPNLGGGETQVQTTVKPNLAFIQRSKSINISTENQSKSFNVLQLGTTIIPQFTQSPVLASNSFQDGLTYDQDLSISQDQDGSLNFWLTCTLGNRAAEEMSAPNIKFNISILASIISSNGQESGMDWWLYSRRSGGDYKKMTFKKQSNSPFITFYDTFSGTFETVYQQEAVTFHLMNDDNSESYQIPVTFYIEYRW